MAQTATKMEPTQPVEEPGNQVDDQQWTELQDEIRQHFKGLSQNIPGFRIRKAQRIMIGQIARMIAGREETEERVICVEGPTGTGKSLGYLIPAIPAARKAGKTLVISTATVALQEQIINKDLPDIKNNTNLSFTYGLAKGRGRYACDRELDRLANDNESQGELDLGEDADTTTANWRTPPQQGEPEMVTRMWRQRESGEFNGDLDTWSQRIRPEVHEEITTTKNGCTGKACTFYTQCPFMNAKAKRMTNDIVVANHSLVLADLTLGGGVILPAPEDTIYVFDEGHRLPEFATKQGATTTKLTAPQEWLSSLKELPAKAAKEMPMGTDQAQAVSDVMTEMPHAVEELHDMLIRTNTWLSHNHPGAHQAQDKSSGQKKQAGWNKHKHFPKEEDIWRFPNGVLEEEFRTLCTQCLSKANRVYDQAGKLNEKVHTILKENPDNKRLGQIQSQSQWLLGAVMNMYDAFADMATLPPEQFDYPPMARWIERLDDGTDHECNACPTSAANMLRGLLWDQCHAAIITSATLASLGRFTRFFEQAGLRDDKGNKGIRLVSPFDYQNNANLYIPALKASPKESDAHTAEIVRWCNNGLLDPAEGTLMLFTSYKQLNEVAEQVDDAIADRMLIQGSDATGKLVETHKRRIDANEGSILAGVASFSEGLDLPGNYCTHVIISKIPFTVPNSPVDKTFAEWLESRNRKPFFEVSVPDAGFKLLQATGRLLRSEQDSGVVTIMDRRLADMRYGRLIMDSLPPFYRNIEPANKNA